MKKELEKLLDSCEFYLSDTGEPYTPKSHFLEVYEKLLNDAESYFDAVEADLFLEGYDSLDDERQIFYDAGDGEMGAYAVIAVQINILQLYTLEFKEIPRQTRGLK